MTAMYDRDKCVVQLKVCEVSYVLVKLFGFKDMLDHNNPEGIVSWKEEGERSLKGQGQ